MFYFSEHESIDDRLKWAFVAEQCVILFVSTTCIAGLTWIICVIVSFSIFLLTYRVPNKDNLRLAIRIFITGTRQFGVENNFSKRLFITFVI